MARSVVKRAVCSSPYWFALAALVMVAAPAAYARENNRALLLISVDGLHPSYVIEAERLGVAVPTLRGFVENGAYATNVINVTPTVTYPNHTTIVTGVAPGEHGIRTNTVFDPEGFERGAWNWYGSQIRVPTLWDAAKAAGLATASVLWPVSVAHPAIDYNMPEYWRTKNRASDSHLLYAISTPRGFLERVDGADRLFDAVDNSEEWSFDEKLMRIALAMIEEGRPRLLTVHLTGLDSAQHKHGPLETNDVARRTLEKTDMMVARLIEAQRAVHPESSIAIVSDHGFHRVDATINLNAAFASAGLIELDQDGKLASWKAYAWNSGGSASVVLKDRQDLATHEMVEAILVALERDADSGVASVLRGELAVMEGALEEASFLVDARGGFAMGGALTGDVVRPQPGTTGAHGYRSTHPEMNASFFMMGPGVQAGRNLGTIDIRQIAPTLARALGASLPTATLEPLLLGE
jgi:predicted AlkP superfamily pyrophosphatase or phosphodiesterase